MQMLPLLCLGPEQCRDSDWGDVRWHCGLQEQGTDQLLPMVRETQTEHMPVKLHATVTLI